MSMLDFLDVLANNGDILEPVFVYRHDYLNADVLLGIFRYDKSKSTYSEIHKYLARFVGECTKVQLELLLLYCTGAKVLPMKEISVKYVNQDGVFSST